MNFFKPWILVLLCTLFLISCHFLSPTPDTSSEAFQKGLRPLQLSQLSADTGSGTAFLDHYHIAPGYMRNHIQYYYGYAGFKTPRVSCHVFMPENPKGTLFVLHGYFDHVGSLSYFINTALDKGYAVFAYDLPGHGDSEGKRGDIGGVEQNAALLETLLQQFEVFLPQPFHLIGFSTGGSIALEYARTQKDSLFTKVVLVSPLVRHVGWYWGKLGYEISEPFLDELPRVDRENSSNAEYLNFAKQDRKRNVQVSLAFLEDIYEWNDRLNESDTVDTELLVIQGDKDEVVDWEYNVPVIERKFRNARVYMVNGGKHQLFNETEVIRSEVFQQIFEVYLQEK